MTNYNSTTRFFRQIKRLFILACFPALSLSAQSFSTISVNDLPELYYSKICWVDFNNDDIKDIFASGSDKSGNLYTTIYINNNDSTFTDIAANFTSVYNAEIALNDFNKDGYIDFLLSGTDLSGNPVTAIYKNNGDNTVTNIGASIAALQNGDVIWEDLNNDTYADIVICGLNASGDKETYLYSYSNGSYTEVSTDLPAVSNGTMEVLDYNKDGFKDILITGINSLGAKISNIYKNNRNLEFEVINTIFDRVSNGASAILDYDSDGDEDVFITGFNHLGSKVSILYSNDGNGIFSNVTSFEPVSSCDVIAADFTNDGLVDILLSGITDDSKSITYLYTNTGSDSFSEETGIFKGVQNGSMAYADFNHDDKNDVLISGYSTTGPVSILYSNTITNSNTEPSVPTNLTATSKHDSVLLAWDISSDDLTASASLTYNIYIGSATQSFDILSPCANITNGENRIIQKGIAGYENSYLVKDLPEGLYYWSVQAIDNATGYSNFASEGSFTICHDISLGNDTSICAFDTLSLSIGTNSDVVNWYSKKQGTLLLNSNTLLFPVIEDDKIIVELTNSLGCTLYDTLSIDTLGRPIFNLGIDQEICLRDTITLATQISASEVYWYSATDGLLNNTDTSIINIIKGDDVIWSMVKNSNGCYYRDSVKITALSLPSVNLGADRDVCYADSTLLQASGYTSVSWKETNSGTFLSGDEDYWYQVLTTDTLTLFAENSTSCVNSDTIILYPIALPVFSLGNDTSICYGSEIKIYPDNKADSLNWYFNRGSISYLDTDTLTYNSYFKDTIVAEYYASTGCVNYDTIIVDTITLPFTDLGNDTSVCYLSTLKVQAPGKWDSIRWYCNDSYLLSNATEYNHFVNKDDSINVEVYSLRGCINYDTIIISRLSLPDFSLPADTALCLYDTLELSLTGTWDTIIWHSTGSGIISKDGESYIHPALNDDSVWVEVTNTVGCSDVDSIFIEALPLPEYTLIEDTTLCYGDWITLKIDSSTYKTNWYDLESDSLILADSSKLMTRIFEHEIILVNVENQYTCIKNDTVYININALPVFSLGADTAVCYGDSISLYVNQNYQNINWTRFVSQQQNDSSAYLGFNVNYTDTISAIIIDSNLCSYGDSIIITKNDLPDLDPGEDVSICQYDSIEIGGDNSNVDYSYYWSPNNNISSENVANPFVSPNETCTYYQEITNQYNCSITDTIIVEVNPQGTVDAGEDATICLNDSVQLGGNPTAEGASQTYSYKWQPAAYISSATVANPIVYPRQTTEYSLIVKSGNCLIDTVVVQVVVNPLPEITTSDNVKISLYDEVQLYAEGGTYYEWTPSNTLDYNDVSNPIASPETTTTYLVKVTNEYGCINYDSIKVELANSLFIPTLFTPNDDGNNDYFKVFGFGIEEISFKIYDLHGVVVFKTDDPNEITDIGWDGTYNGQDVSSGKYIWYMEGTFYDGTPLEFENKNTGIITLLR